MRRERYETHQGATNGDKTENAPGGTTVNLKTTMYQKHEEQEKEGTKERKENTKEKASTKVNTKDQTTNIHHQTQKEATSHQGMNQMQQTTQDGNHTDQHQKEVTLQIQKAQAKEKVKVQEE